MTILSGNILNLPNSFVRFSSIFFSLEVKRIFYKWFRFSDKNNKLYFYSKFIVFLLYFEILLSLQWNKGSLFLREKQFLFLGFLLKAFNFHWIFKLIFFFFGIFDSSFTVCSFALFSFLPWKIEKDEFSETILLVLKTIIYCF